MAHALDWETFHVNHVARLSDRQPLLFVGLTALNHFGLLDTFGVQQEHAINFLRAIEHHYLCDLQLKQKCRKNQNEVRLCVAARVSDNYDS